MRIARSGEKIGKVIVNEQGTEKTEIQGANVPSMPSLRKAQGLLSKIQHVPTLLKKIRLPRGDPWSDKIELVKGMGVILCP